METPETAEWKTRERRAAAERRARAFAEFPDAAAALAAHFHESVPLPRAAVVSGYWPLPGELDIRPLMHQIHEAGHRIALPVVKAKGQPLLFRHWTPGTPLIQGAFKVMTPPEGAPELDPQVLLVPLLAFDKTGYRLGYGGGFYDRTLALLQVPSIGIAYAGQEAASLPHQAHDRTLDMVLTEQGIRRFS